MSAEHVAQIQEAYLDDAYGSSFQLKVAAYWPEIVERLGDFGQMQERAVHAEADRDVARAEAGKLRAALAHANVLLEAHRAEFTDEVMRQGLTEGAESAADVLRDFEAEALADAALAGSDAPPTLSESGNRPSKVQSADSTREAFRPGSLSAAAVPAERET